MPYRSSNAPRGAGFSLVEVVVATAIVSIGLAGLALLLLASVQGTAAARDRSVAVLHAESLGQAATLAPDAAFAGETSATAAEACDGGAECGPAAFQQANHAAWARRLGATLPSPAATLCVAEDAFACGDIAPGIRLDWFEPLDPAGRAALVLRWGSP